MHIEIKLSGKSEHKFVKNAVLIMIYMKYLENAYNFLLYLFSIFVFLLIGILR